MTKEEKIKYLLIPASGFGIGGGLWGWKWFEFLEKVGRSEFVTPFIILWGAIFLGIFGSISLVLFLKIALKKKIFIIFVGTFAWIVGFLVGISDFYFLIASLGFLGVILHFLFTGMIIALIYALVLKIKIWPLVWRGGLGFVIGFFIGFSLVGNLISLLFNNTFLFSFWNEFIVFVLYGSIVGLFLGWGLYKGQKIKLAETKQVLQKT